MTAPAAIATSPANCGIVTDDRHPGWRALILADDGTLGQPEGDLLAPALIVGHDHRADLGDDVFRPRHAHRIEAAYAHLRDPDLFGRYLRQHHGTTTIATATGRDGTVLVFDTADFRAEVGITGTADLTGDRAEWQAWIDGEVYGVTIERFTPAHACPACHRAEPDRWTAVDSIWGFFGHAQATASAAEYLREAAGAYDHRRA